MMTSGYRGDKPQKGITNSRRFVSLKAGGFGSDVMALIARQPHTVLQAKYAEMDDRSPKATEKRAGESDR
jgi:hypothetical protein